MRLWLDTETCGLHGIITLIQYQEDGGEIVLYEPWQRPVKETLDLIEWICGHDVVGFNLVFDWFHISKLYNVFYRLRDKDSLPDPDEAGLVEPAARDGFCLKPNSALDLLLYSRKGPLQVLMDREEVRIRKVPEALAASLASELEATVELPDIFFAARADKEAPKWHVLDPLSEDNAEGFKDVVLKLAPSRSLKAIAKFILGEKDAVYLDELKRPPDPVEVGYAPFALALSSGPPWDAEGRKTWPALVREHAAYWSQNAAARLYARKDVEYTKALDEFWGRPQLGDNDSVLACAVAAVRWHGFEIDAEGIRELFEDAKKRAEKAPKDPRSVRAYLEEVMEPVERMAIATSTSATILEEVATWRHDNGSLHLAAIRAKEVLDARSAKKECEIYEKLLMAGRFHASFKIIGTLSSRMSGADGLNPQGIKHDPWVRRRFPLAWDGYVLSGGDFSSFEVTLADAAFKDEKLRESLRTGRKLHAEMAAFLFGKTYDEIVQGVKQESALIASEEEAARREGRAIRAIPTPYTDMYSAGKQAVFALIYGGDGGTISRKLGVPEEVANSAYFRFLETYKDMAKTRQKIFDSFCSMKQAGGIGTAVTWAEPAEYIESLLGFRRYFTLENQICKALYKIASKPPAWLRQANGPKVKRRDRLQTPGGAAQSALYATAFAMQSANMRAAANHIIQSTGAEITKHVQRRIWDLQPVGVSEWRVAPMNVHDEILVVTHPDEVERVASVVKETVESYRPLVPMIAINWGTRLTSWADTH